MTSTAPSSAAPTPPVVTESAYLTLRYRLATMDDVSIVSTIEGNPAALQLGTGQLAPFLEACLIGLPEGTRHVFELQPEQAFGPRNPTLIQRVSRATLDENSDSTENYRVGDLVDFAAPGGGRFAGVILEINEVDALFDFNHPLAGKPVKFEVDIVSVL